MAIFPGGLGLAGTRMSPFWIVLELMMEVVVTTAAMQSSSQIVTTKKLTPNFFYRPDALPVTQSTVSKHWMEVLYKFCWRQFIVSIFYQTQCACKSRSFHTICQLTAMTR